MQHEGDDKSSFLFFFMRQNKFNELSSKDWLKFTKSWFVHSPPPRKEAEKLHPAKFPEGLVKEFILFFTKKGETVLDPFAGTGSTLVACDETERKGIGIELLEKYATIARKRTKQKVIVGNALDGSLINEQIDFVITSPPYGPMLNKKGLAQKKRQHAGLDTAYSGSEDDLGNIKDYELFVQKVAFIFQQLKNNLKDGGYLVIILQNYRDGKMYRPLAYDVARALSKDYLFVGERIWLQDNKTLFPYGLGYSYVPNVHHHVCLIMRKN
ncbi:MAG TPA: DNA methyltransferase [Candidatus Nanoarchaeia archaeon]|nr:DNA methyltransferase [Candidatus Nanoarchaeia archaeon]